MIVYLGYWTEVSMGQCSEEALKHATEALQRKHKLPQVLNGVRNKY